MILTRIFLADVVGVALDDADHDLAADLVFLVLQVRAQNLQARIHGVERGNSRDEYFLGLKELATRFMPSTKPCSMADSASMPSYHGLYGEFWRVRSSSIPTTESEKATKMRSF